MIFRYKSGFQNPYVLILKNDGLNDLNKIYKKTLKIYMLSYLVEIISENPLYKVYSWS